MLRTGTSVLASNVILDIRQGSDCTWAVRYREQNPDGSTVTNTFSGWAARAQVRARVGGELWLEMKSPDAITLNAADNRLTISGRIEHATTEAAIWNNRGAGVWDLELVRPNGTVVPVVEGPALVSHDVTRSA